MIKVTLYLILLAMTTMIHGYDRLTGESFASRSEVIGQNGMVATSHPLATRLDLIFLKMEVMQLMQLLQLILHWA